MISKDVILMTLLNVKVLACVTMVKNS